MKSFSMRSFGWGIVLAGLVGSADPAHAQLDDESRDLLITKLTRVNRNLAETDSAKVGVTLRLADLLADRARILAMREIEAGCTDCVAGTEDRARALEMYQAVFDRSPVENRPKILIQMGHLHELNQSEAAAEKAYGAVLAMEADPVVKAEAYLSLAEMRFKNHQYVKAREAYEEVLREPKAASRGLAAYRRAWASFNMGEVERASRELVQVLENPELLTRTGVATSEVDRNFQEEVSRDLATFMSKKSVSMPEVEKLFALSPETTRLANVTLLAMEGLRVGRKDESLAVLNFIYGKYQQPEIQLEALVYRLPLRHEFGDPQGALNDFEIVGDLWAQISGCGRPECAEHQRMLRQFVVTWNQGEKRNPTLPLLAAYGHYLRVFPNDFEMSLWAAQVAADLKQWPEASSRIEGAVAGLKNQGGSLTAEELNSKLENALLTGLEMAETSGDDALLARSQAFYLAESALKTKNYEVRYQQARRLYDQGKPTEAANAMRSLALETAGAPKLRKQAADLALDALVLAKNEELILPWALEFAAAFPDHQNDFKGIAQKSILTRTAKLAESNVEAAWEMLVRFDSASATEEDRMIHQKNKLVLAEKTNRIPDALEAADALLGMKGLSAADREMVLGRKAWFSELRLDFATAFQVTEQMALKELSPENKALRLALYADLSGKNPTPFYKQFLKSSKDQEARAAIAAELVKRSTDPLVEIQANRAALAPYPDLMAGLLAEVYEKSPTTENLRKVSQYKEIAGTSIFRSFERISFLQRYEDLRRQTEGMTIDSKTQRTLARSIRSRGQQLEKVDSLAAAAIKMGDWTAQVVTISLVARESDRFYQEIMSLPLPEGLSEEDEQEYMALIAQQATPFRLKAEQARQKETEFWSQDGWRQDLQKSLAAGRFASLITPEIEALKGAAPEEHRAYLVELRVEPAAATVVAVPAQEIETAREALRLRPLDREVIQSSLDLEKRAGNFAMAQYLEGRLRVMSVKEEVQ